MYSHFRIVEIAIAKKRKEREREREMSDYPETVILLTEQSKQTFEQFSTKIPDIIKDAEYDELYG